MDILRELLRSLPGILLLFGWPLVVAAVAGLWYWFWMHKMKVDGGTATIIWVLTGLVVILLITH